MRKLNYLFLLCLLPMGASGTGNRVAQMGVVKPSLEWMAATSDVIVRASVVGMSDKEPRSDPGGGESQSAWITVTLKVHETVKGKHSHQITFVADIFRGSDFLQEWKDSDEELIWFLDRTKVDAEQPKYQDYEVYTRHELKLIRSGWGWSVIQLTTRPTLRGVAPPIFTLDLRVLDDPTAILKAVRAAATEVGASKGVREHVVSVARGLIHLTGRSGDVNRVVVPVDHRLEKAAREWIQSPDEVLKQLVALRPKTEDDLRFSEAEMKYEEHHLRWEGVKALRYFKSDENAAILKSLLNDPAFWHEPIEQDKDSSAEDRVYFVRQEAYETLQKWGIRVHKPVIRERLPRKERG